jgi:hypothetical protein
MAAAPAAASPNEHAPPPEDAKVSRALLDLRGAMMNAGRDQAQTNLARFRPLCDKDGYPLVGNLVGKTGVYQPSQFCSDVRKRENRS